MLFKIEFVPILFQIFFCVKTADIVETACVKSMTVLYGSKFKVPPTS